MLWRIAAKCKLDMLLSVFNGEEAFKNYKTDIYNYIKMHF